jgi:hypothetical protein
MNLQREKELWLETLSDLVKQRRMLTEEILIARNYVEKLNSQLEREKEFMSAGEYINVRNSIRRELETEMREQVRQEILSETLRGKVEEVPSPSVIPTEVIEEAKFNANKASKKDLSPERLAYKVKEFLKEAGRPVEIHEIKQFLEEDLNHAWNDKTFQQTLYKIRKIDERIENPTRGFYQYR